MKKILFFFVFFTISLFGNSTVNLSFSDLSSSKESKTTSIIVDSEENLSKLFKEDTDIRYTKQVTNNNVIKDERYIKSIISYKISDLTDLYGKIKFYTDKPNGLESLKNTSLGINFKSKVFKKDDFNTSINFKLGLVKEEVITSFANQDNNRIESGFIFKANYKEFQLTNKYDFNFNNSDYENSLKFSYNLTDKFSIFYSNNIMDMKIKNRKMKETMRLVGLSYKF